MVNKLHFLHASTLFQNEIQNEKRDFIYSISYWQYLLAFSWNKTDVVQVDLKMEQELCCPF